MADIITTITTTNITNIVTTKIKTITTLITVATIVAMAGVAGMAGCQSANKINTNKVVTINCNRSQLWQLCQQDLKNRYFLLDRVDNRRGIITTYPMLSKQWFEFWRHDAVTAKDVAESSLQTIRRKVIIKLVKVNPTPNGSSNTNNKSPNKINATNTTNNTIITNNTGNVTNTTKHPIKYTVKCTVLVERLAFPKEIVSADVRSGDIFSSDTYYANDYTTSTNPTGNKGKVKGQWNPLGRDTALERDILLSIAHAAEKCNQ